MTDTFNVTILGCGAASPSRVHNPSAQAVEYRGTTYLVDCGEGTQRQLMLARQSLHKVKHIFLTHLHGDHCLGVVPMISTMALRDKGGCLTIHTFAEGARIISRMIDFFCGERDFDIRFNIIDPHCRQTVLETKGMTVEAFPLYHRVDCVGYRFTERPKARHLRSDMLDFYNVPIAMRPAIKEGADLVLPDGRVIANSRLTTDPTPSTSFAYCSDTAFDPRVAEAVSGVDLLYHEATYTDAFAHKAADRGHSTASQAAEIARMAGARRLIIGHYSASVDEADLLREARAIFADTHLARELDTYSALCDSPTK